MLEEAKDEHTHMQAACDSRTFQWLILRVLLSRRHQTRHLILGELNLTATESRERDVSDLVLVCGGRHDEEMWIGLGRVEEGG